MREKDPAKLQRIYRITLDTVLSEGMTSLKMSVLAETAGIATGTLYVYFKSKDILVNSLYAQLQKDFMAAVYKDYDPTVPYIPAFEKLWYNYMSALLQQPEVPAFSEQYHRSPYERKTPKEERAELLRPLYALLERGKEERLVKDMEATLMAAQLYGAMRELARWHGDKELLLNEQNLRQAYTLGWDSVKG